MINEKEFKANKIKEWVAYYGLNEAQSELAFDKPYQDLHSSWCDMVNFCDEYAEFAQDILKLQNK